MQCDVLQHQMYITSQKKNRKMEFSRQSSVLIIRVHIDKGPYPSRQWHNSFSQKGHLISILGYTLTRSCNSAARETRPSTKSFFNLKNKFFIKSKKNHITNLTNQLF